MSGAEEDRKRAVRAEQVALFRYPVDVLARDLHAPAARPCVHLPGRCSGPPGPAASSSALLQRRPDQPVPEQRGVLHPGPPQQPLMLCRRHPRHLPW